MSEFKSVPRALTFLAALGSATAIADEFEKRGIRSVPGCPETCAVAEFIAMAVGTYQVTVDGDEAFGFYNGQFDLTTPDVVPDALFREVLPHVVHQFVVAFDRGEFPTLIASGAKSVLADWSDLVELEQGGAA